MKSIFTTIFITFCSISFLSSQTNFYKSFNIIDHNCANYYNVIKTFDNGYACPVEDGGILKLDSLAQFQFCKMISDDTLPRWNMITQTTDSGFIIAKTEINPDNTTFGSVAKFDKNGNYLWSKKYFNPSNLGRYTRDIISADNNGFCLLADIYCFKDIALIRCNANGDIIWQKTYNSTGICQNITKYSDSKSLILAIDEVDNIYSLIAIMIDTSGNQLWSKEYRFANEGFIPSKPIITFNKDIAILLNVSSVTPIEKSLLMRIDSMGEIQFVPQIIQLDSSNLFKKLFGLCETNDSGYICVGYIVSMSKSWNKILYVKVNNQNNYQNTIEWARTFGNISNNDVGTNLGLEIFNNTNYYYMFSQNNDGLSVTKLDQNGEGFCHFDSVGLNCQSFFIMDGYMFIPPVDAYTLTAPLNFTSYNPTVDTTIYCYNTTSISEDQSINEIKYYPNPTTGQFTIQANLLQRIIIFNIQGKIVQDIPACNNNSMSIDISQVPNAVYFIKFITDKCTIVKIIVKQ